jgi:hypothetical protein
MMCCTLRGTCAGCHGTFTGLVRAHGAPPEPEFENLYCSRCRVAGRAVYVTPGVVPVSHAWCAWVYGLVTGGCLAVAWSVVSR